MRIQRPYVDSDRLQDEIGAAISPAGQTGRVCSDHCVVVCRSCGATGCKCACSRFCPQAPGALTNDPNYPIEPAIAPLVFEMKRLGLFEPCWSCGGHAGPQGEVWKTPAVWFYVSALTHVRLLAGGLAKLEAAGRLSAHWRIAITFSDPDNARPTFSLEPALCTLTLEQLQRDVYEIASALPDLIVSEGKALLNATNIQTGVHA